MLDSLQWKNFFGLAGVVVAVLVPVGLRYIWAKELSEAAEDVVEVTAADGSDDEHGENGDVEIVIHDAAHRNSRSKPAGEDWSRLSNDAAIALPNESSGSLGGNNGNEALASTGQAKSKGWFSKPSGRKAEEGKIRL